MSDGDGAYDSSDYGYFGIQTDETLNELTASCDYINQRAGMFDLNLPKTDGALIPEPPPDHLTTALPSCRYTFTNLSTALDKLRSFQEILGPHTANWFSYWGDYQTGLTTAAAWYQEAEEDNQQAISEYFTHPGQEYTDDGWKTADSDGEQT